MKIWRNFKNILKKKLLQIFWKLVGVIPVWLQTLHILVPSKFFDIFWKSVRKTAFPAKTIFCLICSLTLCYWLLLMDLSILETPNHKTVEISTRFPSKLNFSRYKAYYFFRYLLGLKIFFDFFSIFCSSSWISSIFQMLFRVSAVVIFLQTSLN